MDDEQSERERRFRFLYEANYRQVTAFALRRAATTSDAHEIVAETFLVVWRRLDDVPTGNDALPWLYGVARLVLANSLRSQRRRRMLQGRLTSVHEERVEFDAPVERDAEHQLVRDALKRLKPDDQELLRLIAWENLSHRHVAQILGCSENAVAIRLHRARERLAALLAKDGGGNGHKRPRKEPPQDDPGGDGHR